MKPFTALPRNTRGWIGTTTAAMTVTLVMTGAAACAEKSAQAPSSAPPQSSTASAALAGSSSAKDPHEAAAQREVDRIITTFQAPPGAAQAGQRPDPVPAGLNGPPEWSDAKTKATAVAWYTTSQTPDQVLSWVKAHLPTGSALAGSSSGSSGPNFVSFSYPTPNSQLIVTPATASDGRTVIRLDASVIWTPSRAAGTRLGSSAPSVTVVTTNTLNPQFGLPADETTPATATAPLVVHQVVDLLNALQPPIPMTMRCANDDGTRVQITLPGLASVVAVAGGCGDVTITPVGGQAQHYAGSRDLIPKVYALFGITWSQKGGLPPGTERTLAFEPQ